MSFDQRNQSPSNRRQVQGEGDQSNRPLPPISSEDWEYNRYNSGSMNNRNYPPSAYAPQMLQQTPTQESYIPPYPSSSSSLWEQV